MRTAAYEATRGIGHKLAIGHVRELTWKVPSPEGAVVGILAVCGIG